MDIVKIIEAEGARQIDLANNPQEPMDVIAAEERARTCEKIAKSLVGLGDKEAVAELKRIQEHFQSLANDPSCDNGGVDGMTDAEWFDGLFDQVAGENNGYIEVQSTGIWTGPNGETNILARPAYYRYNGNCKNTSSLFRKHGETDEAWLIRRKEWLDCYHPDVPVRHGYKRGDMTVEMGTVESFTKVEHHVEADLVTLSGFIISGKAEFTIVDVFLNYRNGALGTVRQTWGEPYPPGVHWLYGVPMELIA